MQRFSLLLLSARVFVRVCVKRRRRRRIGEEPDAVRAEDAAQTKALDKCAQIAYGYSSAHSIY